MRTLATLMVVSAGLFFWSYNSSVQVKQSNYDLKYQAAQKTVEAFSILHQDRADAGWALDEVNDPNQSALIGVQYSLITSSEGNLGSKLTSINPNFTAVILQMLLDAGVKRGDRVAVAFTGSFPALNIAVTIACELLDVEPVIITSVASSMWGANEPEFTYLDIESILKDHGVIQHTTVAASIGGGDDIGRSLSKAGRVAIEEAIHNNEVIFIDAGSLSQSQQDRRTIYQQYAGDGAYAAFINVGGGVSVLGHSANGRLIPPGLSKTYLQRNYPAKGVIHDFWEKSVPVIHLLNVNEIAVAYGLPLSPVPLPPVGSGEIFTVERHNLTIAWISVIILFGLLFTVLLLDRDKHKLWEQGVDPDTLM